MLTIDALDASPQYRRGEVHNVIEELKVALEGVHHQSPGDSPVSLPVGIVAVIAHTLLRHQP